MSTHIARCLLTLYAGDSVPGGTGRIARHEPGTPMPAAWWPFRIGRYLGRLLGR